MLNNAEDHELVKKLLSDLVDGRSPSDIGGIMVTLEGVVSGILLYVMDGDAEKAGKMLNEGLVPGVELRLALAASKQRGQRR